MLRGLFDDSCRSSHSSRSRSAAGSARRVAQPHHQKMWIAFRWRRFALAAEIKSASREGRPSAGRSRGNQRKPAEQADYRKEMQNGLPHRDLVLKAERGRASRGALLDAHVAKQRTHESRGSRSDNRSRRGNSTERVPAGLPDGGHGDAKSCLDFLPVRKEPIAR
jgi:hypothetical protein